MEHDITFTDRKKFLKESFRNKNSNISTEETSRKENVSSTHSV